VVHDLVVVTNRDAKPASLTLEQLQSGQATHGSKANTVSAKPLTTLDECDIGPQLSAAGRSGLWLAQTTETPIG
jgi:hypothetical protein